MKISNDKKNIWAEKANLGPTVFKKVVLPSVAAAAIAAGILAGIHGCQHLSPCQCENKAEEPQPNIVEQVKQHVKTHKQVKQPVQQQQQPKEEVVIVNDTEVVIPQVDDNPPKEDENKEDGKKDDDKKEDEKPKSSGRSGGGGRSSGSGSLWQCLR